MANIDPKYFAFVLNNEVVDTFEKISEMGMNFAISQRLAPSEQYTKINTLTFELLQLLEKLHLQIKEDMFPDAMIVSTEDSHT